MIQFKESKANLIAEGGEGRIYAYRANGIIKIFKDHVNKRDKLAKIQKLMTMTVPSSIVTAIDLVYNDSQEFIGYLMPKVKGEEFHILSSRKFVKSNNITKKIILQMLLEISTTLEILHKQHIFIGDLSDQNILFDDTYHVHFIDVDSWSIEQYACDVINDAFKDPNLMKTGFNAHTDMFAFSIIAYKALTRLHPFGGTLKSDVNMNLEDRMKKKLSVIHNDDVNVPKIVDNDAFMPSKLLNLLNVIYTTNDRESIASELNDFYDHLKLCTIHNDYYYSLYDKCPICEMGATETIAISSLGTVDGIPVRILFSDPLIKLIFDELTYLTKKNEVKFRNSAKTVPFARGKFYYTNADGSVIVETNKETIRITTPKRSFDVEKKYNTGVVIQKNDVFYVSENLILTRFGLANMETSFMERIEDVSINNLFAVQSLENYFICNSYDKKRIVSISGFHYDLINTEKIINSVIQYDELSKTWLFIFETVTNRFITTIFDKTRGVIYLRDDIRYIGDLKNLCYYNELIYKPSESAIVRFNYKTSEYKEFKISVVTTNTKLIKKQNKFIAINDAEIYEIG